MQILCVDDSRRSLSPDKPIGDSFLFDESNLLEDEIAEHVDDVVEQNNHFEDGSLCVIDDELDRKKQQNIIDEEEVESLEERDKCMELPGGYDSAANDGDQEEEGVA